MIDKLEQLDPAETIIAKVVVTKIEDDYTSYMELEFSPDVEPSHLMFLLRELSSGFTDCRFKLDRIIDQI